MKPRYVLPILLFASAASSFVIANAVSKQPTMLLPPRNVLRSESDYLAGWMDDSLKGDNKPYAAIRTELNKRAEQPPQLANSIAGFEAAARVNPRDPKAIFRYVFAKWRYEKKPNYKELSDWMYYAPSPQAYDYVRLHWLMLANQLDVFVQDSKFLKLGERLLEHKPNDEYVSYWVRKLRDNSKSLDDKHKNLADARKLVKAKPNDDYAQGALGSAYFHLWMLSKKRSDANLTIKAYKRYLELAPKNAPFRKDAQFWINAIPKNQDRWEKQGIGSAS